MLTRLLTLRFLNTFLRKKPRRVNFQSTTLSLASGKDLAVDTYHPLANSKGTIVFIHGMHFAGKDEVNAKLLARCLATTGFTVLVPHYERIANYDLAPDNILTINQSLQAIVTEWQTSISIFATSFAAIHSLYAAALPNVCDQISTLLLMGSPFRYQSCIPAIVDNPVINVGHLIVDLNFSSDPEEQVTLSEKIRQHQSQPKEFLSCDDVTISHEQLSAFDQQVEQLNQLSELKASVCLIHGKTDDIIPASESVALAESLTEHDIKHFITVNPLISHVKQQFSWQYLLAGQQLLQAFDFFFRDAQNH